MNRTLCTALPVLALIVLAVGAAGAQTSPADTAATDTTAVPAVQRTLPSEPFFGKFTNKPKAGVKAGVQRYDYYGELETTLSMRRGAQAQNKIDWGWQDYRSYDKIIETRRDRFSYIAGAQLPFMLDVTGNWDWSEDRSTNSLGTPLLIKRDNRRGAITGRLQDVEAGGLLHSLTAAVGVVDESSENRAVVSELSEGTANAHLQSVWSVDPGLHLAGRFYGEGAQGDRLLRGRTDTAKALGDSVGAGAYYDRGWLKGRAELTRSTFDSEYLDWRRNDRGGADTTGVDFDDQIVRERRVANRQVVVFENAVRWGRFGLSADLKRTLSEVGYARSLQGLTEDFDEKIDLQATFAVGRDSFVTDYGYSWVWNDQELQDGTRRGRQNTRNRQANLKWIRPVFSGTRLIVDMGQKLNQQIPDNRPNGQNVDQLTSDMNASLRRKWGDSETNLSVKWNQVQYLAIGADKSIENNTRDRYTIAPKYAWQIADWLRLSQDYSLYIEYKTYDHPDDKRRRDNYDKRGKLKSWLTIRATKRLRLAVAHTYNRTIKALRTGDAIGGGDVYSRNYDQTVSSIDFDIEFEPVSGVILEASTVRGRDDVGNPQTDSLASSYKGDIRVGVKARRKWGKTRPLEISAEIMKVNAYGPGIRPESADYWQADTWVKWSF